MIRVLTVIILMLMAACGERENNRSNIKGEYFDIQEFFRNEAASLSDKSLSLDKRLIREEETETLKVINPDWLNEFSPFLEVDINKPAYRGAFLIDSLRKQDSLTLYYQSIDSETPVNNIKIFMVGDTVKELRIVKSVSNIYYKSTDTLEYFRSGNYRIRVKSKPRAGRKIEFVLEARAAHE
jgi:hypothetical protein